jgi:hypothetical protein
MVITLHRATILDMNYQTRVHVYNGHKCGTVSCAQHDLALEVDLKWVYNREVATILWSQSHCAINSMYQQQKWPQCCDRNRTVPSIHCQAQLSDTWARMVQCAQMWHSVVCRARFGTHLKYIWNGYTTAEVAQLWLQSHCAINSMSDTIEQYKLYETIEWYQL